jgi:hypothetical protein
MIVPSKNPTRLKQSSAYCLLLQVSCLAYSSILKMEEILVCCPKCRLTLTGLYGIVFIVSAVSTSYPTNRLLAELHNGCHTALQTVTISIAQNANTFPSGFVRYLQRSASNKTYVHTFMSSVQNFSRRT